MTPERWKRIVDLLVWHKMPVSLALLAIEKIKRAEVYEPTSYAVSLEPVEPK